MKIDNDSLTLIVNIIGGICGIGGLLFGICSTWFILRQVAHEHTALENERVLAVRNVADLQRGLTEANEKIFLLEKCSHESSKIMTRFDENLTENTRVLRKVEGLFMDVARIEQRIDSHIIDNR